jgi:pyruvate/2-oxoglutarate dehydrogenase complex dihydrolipoamide acyltransferase (E2) component
MITEIRAPKTGLTAETITIVKWHKGEGDAIAEDELLLTIESEKATLDIEARRSGYLGRITAQEGDIVPISKVIGYIADSADEQFNNTHL